MSKGDVGMLIGPPPSHEITVLTDSIIRIMDAKADQKTIRAAITVLARSADVRNLTISDVAISMGAPSPLPPSPEGENDE